MVGPDQPFAGAVTDRIGTGRVILLGVALVALGTVHHAVHDHHGRADLCDWRAGRGWRGHGGAVRADGGHCAAGAAAKAGLASGIVNAGGSFGQFVMAPIAISLTAAVGWASACSGWACWCCWRCRR